MNETNITEKIKALMDDTGCEEAEAKMALDFMGGNFNKAIAFVGAMLKYITAYKAKISIKNENIFGLIHIITNNKNLDLLKFSTVMSYNPVIYEQDIKVDWFSFEKEIYSCRLLNGVIENYTKTIDTKLKEFVNVNLKDNKILNAQDVKTVIETFFSDSDVNVEIVAQELTLREFRKLPDYFPEEIPKESSVTDSSSLIELEAIVFEDSAGKKVEDVVVGDKVLAKIIDTRDIAHYIGHLIGAKKEQTMIPIPAEVQSVEKKDNGYVLKLKYSDLIFGVSHVETGRVLKILETRDTTTWNTKLLPFLINN
ncbi:MAG: hypothetical protein II816_01260 [Elusimicrobia bacterium]|nr:hypothetical protein [Elusimicrobiota bacterium]